MKYIRTKDGVYDTSKGIYTPSIKMWAIGIKTIYRDEILKQADTIEELCDGFVTSRNRHLVWDKEQIPNLTFEKIKLSYPSNEFKIYGAIWTDKGLIYVAKMNENGELELI